MQDLAENNSDQWWVEGELYCSEWAGGKNMDEKRRKVLMEVGGLLVPRRRWRGKIVHMGKNNSSYQELERNISSQYVETIVHRGNEKEFPLGAEE